MRFQREPLERSRVRQALRDDLAGEVIYNFDQKLSHDVALLVSTVVFLPLPFAWCCWLPLRGSVVVADTRARGLREFGSE